jgi:hypothetical protein
MAAMAEINVPVWPWRGLFPVRTVGVSHRRETIAELVGPDTLSVHFVPVLLFPYNSNSEDPNAVAVMTVDAPKQLGHLPRDLAVAYRERMRLLGRDGPSVCPAAISGGWTQGGHQYDYALELDLDLADAPGFDVELIEPQSEPLWVRISEDNQPSQVFKVWLREPASQLHCKMRVNAWSKPEGGTINYFAERAQGGGYGLKLFEVELSQHKKWFASREVEADLFEFDGRWATVYLDPIEPSRRANRWTRQGGHPTRHFLMLQERLSETYRQLRDSKNPERKFALAVEGQQLQYELAELGAQLGVGGRTLKEMAGATWNLITQAYIGVIVRGLLAVDKDDEAGMALKTFLSKAPQHAHSNAIVSLEKQIKKAPR